MLLEKITSDLKKAQLEKEALKVSVLRMLISSINYAKISKGQDLSEPEIVSLVQKEFKKRQESIEAFRQGGREDLARKEESEAAILQQYLPVQLSDSELENIVQQSIQKIGATDISQMGKVMAEVMSQAAGKADGSRVSALVKQKLNHD